MRVLSYPVGEEHRGMQVQQFLMRCHGYSRRMVTRLKREPDGILRNGSPLRMVDLLEEGDLLTVSLRETPEQPTISPNPGLFAPVCYEDSDVVVFDKPAGMPVHPSHLHREDTLANYYMSRCAQAGDTAVFRPVNRLDRNTSGLCVVAKNAVAAAKLAGRVEKTYLAVVQGDLPESSGVIDAPIARAQQSIIVRVVSPQGKPAVTRFRRLRRCGSCSLVEVTLETGRTHQIRVHFSWLGYPLAGDDLYGGDTVQIGRQALHCAEVSFLHPQEGRAVHVTCPLPEDMQSLIHSTPRDSA